MDGRARLLPLLRELAAWARNYDHVTELADIRQLQPLSAFLGVIDESRLADRAVKSASLSV
jgi:hypothetical protein